MAVVAPTAQHHAGFHPTAVIRTFGAALGLDRSALRNARGIAGSLVLGMIEYLAEGTWTKRPHPGWAAQSGLRAARLVAEGFRGPSTVFEGTHGFITVFGMPLIVPDYAHLSEELGQDWRITDMAYKPHAC